MNVPSWNFPKVTPFEVDRGLGGDADANADGSLSADEYKAFVSKNYGEQK